MFRTLSIEVVHSFTQGTHVLSCNMYKEAGREMEVEVRKTIFSSGLQCNSGGWQAQEICKMLES